MPYLLMSPPEIMVQKAIRISTRIYENSSTGELTDTEHDWYVANAAFRS